MLYAYQLARIIDETFLPEYGRGKYVWVRAMRPQEERVKKYRVIGALPRTRAVFITNLVASRHTPQLRIAPESVELMREGCNKPPLLIPEKWFTAEIQRVAREPGAHEPKRCTDCNHRAIAGQWTCYAHRYRA